MNLELLHPLFVHFPVALTLVGAAFLAYGTLRDKAQALPAGFLVLMVSGAMIIPTYITGQVARAVLEDSAAFERDLPLLDTHEDLGLASFALIVSLGILSGLALSKGKEGAKPWAPLLLALAASALIALTAFYGGRLVFEHGIGVRIEPTGPRTHAPMKKP